ncbi:MAG: hypothetical protein IID46_12345, partial [Planctomycetes bacterium]|nr:hypothetical protein [Planctomycetota bacterium]
MFSDIKEHLNRQLDEIRAENLKKDPAFQVNKIEAGKSAKDIGLDEATKSAKQLTDALRALEASVFPLEAAFVAEDKIRQTINEAAAEGITLSVEENELIKRTQRSIAGLSNAKAQLAERVKLLQRLLVAERASLEEVEVATRKATIATLEQSREAGDGIKLAFLKLQNDASNAAKFTEKVFSDAFESVSEGITNMLLGIETDFNAFIRNLGAQLVKLGVQQALLSAGSLFPGAPASPTSGAAGIGGFVTDFFGFKHGGAFKVG